MDDKIRKIKEIIAGMADRIEELESLDKHGTWIEGRCSVCSAEAINGNLTPYCPYCGARLADAQYDTVLYVGDDIVGDEHGVWE